MHCVVKRDCFAFAIRISTMFDLLGSFPLRGETVRNCPEIADPIVDQRKREILIFLPAVGSQDGTDSGHLVIVWRGVDGDVVRLRKS